jgi:heat shock protein HslJ
MESPPAGSPATPPAQGGSLEGTEWRLTHHRAPDGHLVPVPAGILASAVFDAGVVSGSTGCNRYHGSYEVVGPAISLGPVASTLMACEPARDAVERAFTSALAGTVAHAVAGETLELLDADGRVVLRFRAAPPPSLVGTRWVATGINNGRGGVVSALEGVEVTAVFEEDGSVAGSGGCNRFHGRYSVDGVALAFGPLAATRKACAVPDGVDEQEAAYLAALERVATWSLREDRLELRSADGALQVELRAEGRGD